MFCKLILKYVFKMLWNINLVNVNEMAINLFMFVGVVCALVLFLFHRTIIQIVSLPLAPRFQPRDSRYLPYTCLSYNNQSSCMGSSELYWISIQPPSLVQSEELLKRNPKACNIGNGIVSNYQWYELMVTYVCYHSSSIWNDRHAWLIFLCFHY